MGQGSYRNGRDWTEKDSRKTRTEMNSNTFLNRTRSNRIGSDQNVLKKILGPDRTVFDRNRLKKYLHEPDPIESDLIEPKRTPENTEMGRVGQVNYRNGPDRTETVSRKYPNHIIASI